MSTVIGLYYDPRPARQGRSKLAQRYWRAVWHKANPRSAAYMRALFLARWPQGRFVDLAQEPAWREALAGAGTVVRLYPDATGLGQARVDRAARRGARGAELWLLNGRRRQWAWSRGSEWRLRLRRALERTMAGECLAGGALLLLLPWCVAWDRLRGRA